MTSMRVLPSLEPVKDRHLRLRLALEPPSSENLSLERGKETLSHSVVVSIAHSSHRRHDASLPTTLAESVTCVLPPVVGMMDQSGIGLSHRDCHVDSCEHQLSVQACSHRPANNLAREHIEHDSQ